MDLDFFSQLGPGDVLFIDSSHTVKIGGDVNYLFLEVLPRLKPGVIVHVHDIFFPFDYRRDWVKEELRFGPSNTCCKRSWPLILSSRYS